MIEWEIGKLLKVALIAQLAMCITVILDVPIARQFIGFAYLSFLPGIILMKILGIHETNLIETILYSVGLSIAFSMFVGLLVNEIFPLIGILNPLSPQPLLTTIIIVTLIISASAYIIERARSARSFSNHVNTRANYVVTTGKSYKSAFLILCLPFLSIIGGMLLDSSGNNSISFLVVGAISGVVVLSSLSKKINPRGSYSATLLVVAISLLFLSSFTSKYLIGYDIPIEHYVLKLTMTNFHWSSVIPSANSICATYNSMLSITILPTIYSYILNIDSIWILKIAYPLIFSFIALGLYQVYRKQMGELVAFLSTVFFLFSSTFFDQMLGLTRQMIGELFLVLLVLVLLNKSINKHKRMGLLVIFGAALIVSHYSVSYIFMFLVLGACLFLPMMGKPKQESDRRLTWGFVLVYFLMALSWYTYVSASAPIIALANVGRQVWEGISLEFLNPVTRSTSVLTTIGLQTGLSPIHEIGIRVFQITLFFILIGFVKVILKRKVMKLDPIYYLMSLGSMAILFMSILLPYLAFSLEMTRIYHLALIFLAPFLVLGVDALFGWKPKMKRVTVPVICAILVTFLLFQSGFIYELTQDVPSWGALSKNRINPLTNLALYSEYIHEQDVFSVRWLSQNKGDMSKIYSDRYSHYHVLTAYSAMPPQYQGNWDYLLSNETKNVDEGAYVYLGNLNIVYGLAEGPKPGLLWNITEISPFLNGCNCIYSNGGNNVYKALVVNSGD